jgi:hypothetical protein
MNQELDTPTPRPGAFISETAVRGALERRTRSLTTHEATGGASQPTDAAADSSSRGNRPRLLRRWSVAELIAGALARLPAGGVAH